MTTLPEIDAQIAALKAQKKALKPRLFSPGIRSRSFRPEGQGQRDPRQKDAAFLSWLHVDTACIACLIEGEPANPHGLANAIEAAHQNLAIAGKGWRERGGGKRIHDARCVPLCTLHHTGLPNACDNGQRKFWVRLGLGDRIADLCADLFAAFKADKPAIEVIRLYADSTGKGRG